VVSDNELTLVGTQGVPTGRRRPGLLFAPLRERFRGRGPGVLCFVLACALRWERRWEGEEGGPVERGGRGRAPGCAAGWRAVGALRSEADASKGRRGRG
jgi:hypothetical protein